MIFHSLVVGPLGVNCYILGCGETLEGVVVDPGGDAGKIATAVEQLGLKIVQIINTHGHFDHIGANQALRERFGASLLIHAADAPLLTRSPADIARGYSTPGESSSRPDSFLSDGMEIAFGKCRMTVLHTPGHTQGGCCLYIEAEKRVITGDTLFADSIGRTDLYGGSHEQLLESIRTKLFTLPEEVQVYPGHGPESSIGHEKLYNPYF